MWSEDGPIYIIAEAGSNHDGKLEQALELIEVAADARCDAVKFQCLAPFRREWWPSLDERADSLGLDLLATPFDLEAVRFLQDVGCPILKIASPEIVNLPLIAAAAGTRLPLILSTGMACRGEVYAAYRAAKMVAGGLIEIALLQCTTRYPTPPNQVNLQGMETLRGLIGELPTAIPVGLSDHTLGIAVPIAAAALGARIIEKHYTISHGLEGPDHHYALEPDELANMVEDIRIVEQALGDGRKTGPLEGELVEARGRSLTWT